MNTLNAFYTKEAMVSLRNVENILIKNEYINFFGYISLWTLNKLMNKHKSFKNFPFLIVKVSSVNRISIDPRVREWSESTLKNNMPVLETSHVSLGNTRETLNMHSHGCRGLVAWVRQGIW